MNKMVKVFMLGSGKSVINYLFDAEFSTATPAPLPSPFACEIDNLTITDTASRGSIAGGDLVIASGAAAFLAQTASFARVAGRAVYYRESIGDNNGMYVGIDATNTAIDRLDHFGSLTRCYINGDTVLSIDSGQTSNVKYKFLVVSRDAGNIYLRESTGNDFKVLYITKVNAHALQMSILPNNSNACKFDFVKIVDLPQFNSQLGWATSAVANPGNNETVVSAANAFIEFTLVAQAGVTQSIWFRRTTDDETFRIDCDQAGGTIKLYKRTGGVDSELDAGKTQTWVAGNSYRVCIRTIDNAINTFVANVAKHSASDAFNNTATGVKVSHAGSNLFCFPSVVTLPSNL